MVNRPQDWDPTEYGFNVSLDHDYGQHDTPAGKPVPKPVGKAKSTPQPSGLTGAGPGKAKTIAEALEADVPEVQKTSPAAGRTGEATQPLSSLLKGKAGYHAFEQRREAAKQE